MIKNIVLLFNILILTFFQNLFQNEPSITHNFPEKINPGSEFNVDIEVNKDQINGFAKLQIDLPEGFSATAIDAKGASYTFKDQKVKFIWMALPNDASFKVTILVKVDAAVSGSKSIVGEFAYLEENDKKIITIPEKLIMVGDGDIAEATPETTATEEPVVTPTETTISETQPTVSSQTEAVEVKREIDYSNLSNKELTVTVIINKGEIQGFSKLQETLPTGFTASSLDAGNSTFAFDDQKVKFLWMNLPSDPEFKISYKVKIDANLTGTYFLNGEFSYMEDGETKKKIIEQQAVDLSGGASQTLAETKTEEPEKTDAGKKEEPIETETPEVKKEKPVKAVAPVTSTPAPVTGINYRVQIAASHMVVESDYFSKKHNFTDPFTMEMHEGWNKYTTGGFPQYKNARDHREQLKDKIPTGPFVTAYNDGTRITVQEALMLSQQKWVK